MKHCMRVLTLCLCTVYAWGMEINLQDFPSDNSAVSSASSNESSFDASPASSVDLESENIEYESDIDIESEEVYSDSEYSDEEPPATSRQTTHSAGMTTRIPVLKRTHDEIEDDCQQKRITDFFSPGNTDLFAAHDAALAQQAARPSIKRRKTSQGAVVTQMATQTVARSIVGYTKGKWKLPQQDDVQIHHVIQKYNVSRPVAQTLINRGHITDDQIEDFIHTSYEKNVPCPSLLKNANKVVARLKLAITRKEKILICGDYDVDGMTSSALLITCLRPLGALIDYHIPHRIRDGYGLKTETIERAAREGYKVVITVDNGITSFGPATKAKELGIDLIITDHHLAHDGIPDAYAVVNPNQPECTYPYKSLAGVGVAFKLMCLLYEQKKLELPNKAYELMMLGTIADVVPLEDENRYWVRRGLTLVNHGLGSDSYKKLLQNSKKQGRINSIDIAFSLTPQLNALGRLDDANKGVKFLLGDSINDIEQIGVELLTYNLARKKLQLDMTRAAINRIKYKKEIDMQKDQVIILADSNWHQGVNGLVASKISERFFKPTIIATETRENDGTIVLKGSARSGYSAVNLFECLKHCKDLLVGFGGHKVAAGLVLKKENLELLKMRLNAVCVQEKRELPPYEGFPIDSQASFTDIKPQLFEDLHMLEPFGNQNPQPTFLFNNVQVALMPQWLGKTQEHVKCTLVDESGERCDVKFFFHGDMYGKLRTLREKRARFALIGHPDENHWNGTVKLEINGIDIENIEKSIH